MYTLTAKDTNNNYATAFDVKLKFFINKKPFTGSPICGSNFYSSSYGALSSCHVVLAASGTDALTAACPYTELDCQFDGSFNETLNGNSVTWTANLTNAPSQLYQPEINDQILCYRKISDFSSGSITDWHLWWNGIVSDISGAINKHADSRTVTVKGIDQYLRNKDVPRLVISSLNMSEDASVEVSSTLATPESEVGTGEFIGSIVECGGANIVDGRMDTLWISQDTPVQSVETVPNISSTPQLRIDEFFYKPNPGWDAQKVWWIELLNIGDSNVVLGAGGYALAVYNHLGETAHIDWLTKIDKWNEGGTWSPSTPEAPSGTFQPGPRYGNTEWSIPPGERAIVCYDKNNFDAYTGGAPHAQFITEAKLFHPIIDSASAPTNNSPSCAFNLRPEGGYIVAYIPGWADILGITQVTDVVCWGRHIEGQDMATRLPDYVSVGTNSDWNSACALDGNINNGYSYRRSPTGCDSNGKVDWIAEQYPKPGDKFDNAQFEWVKIELRANNSTLTTAASVGNTYLLFDTLLGWPVSGSGLIEGEIITYSSRNDTRMNLTGSMSNPHAVQARAYPLHNGVSQSGWPLDTLQIQRKPGTETIKYYQVFTSYATNANTPANEDWQFDYEYRTEKQQNGRVLHYPGGSRFSSIPVSDITVPTLDINGDPQWIRTILIIIYEMAAGGRAKINNLVCNLAGNAVNNSGFNDIENRTAGKVIKYVLDNYTDLSASNIFSDNTEAYWGAIGNVQTAIAPIPDALDDLCGNAGCWIRYAVDGRIELECNPYWPGRRLYPTTALTNDNVRDYIDYNQSYKNVTGIKLNALQPDGTPITEIVVPPGASGTGVIELSDITVTDQAQAFSLAVYLYYKEKLERGMGLTIRGVGSGFFVGQQVALSLTDNSGYTTNYGNWIITNVTVNWSDSETKQWETVLTLNRVL